MTAPDRHKEFLAEFLAHRESLYTFIFVLIRSHEKAEELFQEVSLLLWEKFDTYRPGTAFGAWARQIAIYKIQSERRRLARHPLLLSPDALQQLDAAFARIDDRGTDEDWRQALMDCMQRLAPAARKVVELRYYKDFGLDQIAGKLGRTATGVNSTLCKARAALETCLNASMGGSGSRAGT